MSQQAEQDICNYLRTKRPDIVFIYEGKKELYWLIEVLRIPEEMHPHLRENGLFTYAKIKSPHEVFSMPKMSCRDLYEVINMKFVFPEL